jgi:hypothetical protein
MNHQTRLPGGGCIVALTIALDLLAAPGPQGFAAEAPESGWEPLFPQEGVPQGWRVGAWNDVSQPAPGNPVWRVVDGVLHGGEPRGSWLLSEKIYADFELEFEFRLGPRGNSGCALRAPAAGDPAFDGLELQMADLRYNLAALDSELTGGLYRAAAPNAQVYRPEEWNAYRIRCLGSTVQVTLNGTVILDVDLNDFAEPVKRHDGRDAPPLKDRPRRGHIGFQELSREGAHTQIRHARIRALQ